MRIIDLFALRVFAKNLDRCNFRLLQRYLPEADAGWPSEKASPLFVAL